MKDSKSHLQKLLILVLTAMTIVLFSQAIYIGNLLNQKELLDVKVQIASNEIESKNDVVQVMNSLSTINYSSVQEKSPQFIIYSMPLLDTSFKSFMDYKTITSKSSDQYKLQEKATTDEYGLRKIDECYLVAMGTFYTENVGDKFKITLEDGDEFFVIIGDVKQDCHTDVNNQYAPVYCSNGEFLGANIIEFIVDTDELSKEVRNLGSVGAYDFLDGNIVKIQQIL